MPNFKNTIYKQISDKRTIPFNSIGTGTIVTNGAAITGTGTLFKTELMAGSWIVDLAQNEIRYIERVDSDTVAYMSQAFTVDISVAVPLNRIARKDSGAVSLSINVPAGAATACLVDGEVFPIGLAVSFSKDSRDYSSERDLVNPLILDATGSTMNVLIQY